MDVSKFVGLSKHKAQDLAEASNIVFRLVSVDDEIFLGYPPIDEPNRTDRVCVEVVNGKVTRALMI